MTIRVLTSADGDGGTLALRAELSGYLLMVIIGFIGLFGVQAEGLQDGSVLHRE